MSKHRATISWVNDHKTFDYKTFSRDHWWQFEGGAKIQMSSAPEYGGNPACMDPEKALVASLSSCHMLTFLALCALKQRVVKRYTDKAIGYLGKNAEGATAITKIVLQPKVVFGEGAGLSTSEVRELHQQAHEKCFVANSLRADMQIEPS